MIEYCQTSYKKGLQNSYIHSWEGQAVLITSSSSLVQRISKEQYFLHYFLQLERTSDLIQLNLT